MGAKIKILMQLVVVLRPNISVSEFAHLVNRIEV